MSTEKTEALRLAEFLEMHWCDVDMPEAKAAAELRRLHASCEDYAQHKQRQDRRVLALAERVLELKAQRDALLGKLKTAVVRAELRREGAVDVEVIRAAIKAVEEQK